MPLDDVSSGTGSVKNDDFVESDHPRASDGKFGSGGATASAKLTPKEKAYATSYSGDDFLRINSELRAGKADDPAIQHLDSAVSKSPLPKGTTLYRGMSRDAAKKLFANGEIKRGETISDPAFSSTSKYSSEAGSRALGGVVLKIETGDNATGLDMDEHSSNKAENEVLLPRNAKMTVLGVVAPKKLGDPVVVRVSYGDSSTRAIGDSELPTAFVDDVVGPKIARAAGICFVAPDGHVLLMRRTDGQGWAFPGGGIEGGETAEQAARREFQEECGLPYEGDLREWTRRIKDGVDFTTFVGKAASKFAPILNAEHDAYTWATRDVALGGELPIHPGVSVTLLRFDMDELGIAKAIRNGELVSPQMFANVLLVALRITGTGASYRDQDDQYVWRDASLYLNDHFLERCNGLAVIMEHPEKAVLNSKEFHDRIIGTILLPYLQGEEVWGIAKIYDEGASKMLQTDTLSTSPGVVVVTRPSDERPTMDGKTILIEEKPFLLDHLAICERGVWDKGGPPMGVQNDVKAIGDSTTTEVTTMDEQVAGAAGTDEHGAKLDKLMDSVLSLHGKHDALCSRMDALETKPKEEGNLETAGEVQPVVAADAADPIKEEVAKKADAGDVDPNPKADSEEPVMDSKHDAAIKALNDKLDAALKAIPKQLSEDDRQKFTAAQVAAERVYQAFGDSKGAPAHQNGETLLAYRRRLLTPYKQHSAAWKDVDLSAKTADVLDIAESQIYNDAMVAATSPASIGAGKLREVITRDRTGRPISSFVGDATACWDQFTQKPFRVTGWKLPTARHPATSKTH